MPAPQEVNFFWVHSKHAQIRSEPDTNTNVWNLDSGKKNGKVKLKTKMCARAIVGNFFLSAQPESAKKIILKYSQRQNRKKP